MSDADGVRDLERALEQMTTLLDAVDAATLTRPTPCTNWSVAQLADHVVGTTGKFADQVAGGEVSWADLGPVEGDHAPAFASAAARLREAWADPSEGANPDWQCAELCTHTWDLATALGEPTAGLDQAPAERGLAFMRANLKDELRGEAFAAAQEPPTGADAYTRIAAFAGRRV